MGNLMRQYWLPAAMSSELKADGEPMRLLLLGEKLIAFRDTTGRVGVMDQKCPHRCASLFLGRNEENGIRCVYHGWKFDTQGNCVDMPSVPPERDFKHLVKAKAYKAVERNGLVWVYMGERKEAPPLPQIEATLLPESDVTINFAQRECNWLQALEGDIDTCHFGFLHGGAIDADMLPDDTILRYTAPIALRGRTRPTGASPISCCRSGPRRRRASSRRICTIVPGSRWTTTTRCSSASDGRMNRPSSPTTETAI
jgi:phenylpropionate dioxygenase-like ring-hydroxylating dioxygenase large terminal subunit